jgi:uncharacterized protein YjbJ (UPF0337 family)
LLTFTDLIAVANAAFQRSPIFWKTDLQRKMAEVNTFCREQTIAAAITSDLANSEDAVMDKDRIKGSAEQAKGSVKEAAGKVFGDKKLEADGNADKTVGKVQNAVGGLKDAVRGK